jgi:hypothetical protein
MIQGTRMMSNRPEPVHGLTGVADLSLGDDFACARRHDGVVACWGSAGAGQLLGEPEGYPPAPVALPDLADATLFALGYRAGCAKLRDGTVACWGDGTGGQLGRDDGRVHAGPLAPVAW